MAMEWRGASVGRRLGALAAGALVTGAGQFVLGNHRRGIAYVAIAFLSAVAIAFAAFFDATLMATLMLWAIAFFLFSLLDTAIRRPASTYPAGAILASVLVGLFLFTRIMPLVIRAYVIEAFRIPSGSMAPTLLSGDHVFLDKMHRHPERGDVIVYRLPASAPGGGPLAAAREGRAEPSKELVKRVIGLPGDEIETKGNALFLNGEEQPHVFREDIEIDEADCAKIAAQLSEETLTGGRAHPVLDIPRHESDFLDGRWKVPDGELFVIGDNRDNSMDSRSGYTVPLANVRGIAMFIYFSWDNCETRLRTERFGQKIR